MMTAMSDPKIMKIVMTIAMVTTLLTVQAQLAAASIETLIKNVMPKGTMSNVSSSGIVKDQLSGHLIGGSVMIKTPSTDDLNLLNFQAPKCNIGGLPCAAQFDLRGGALSFINSAEMMTFLKNLAQNAGVYGGLLAVKTICPGCEDLMTWMENVQRSVNQHMNMSCNDMMGQVAGVYAKMGITGEANRQSHLVTTGGARDMTEIAQKSKKGDGNDPADTNPNFKSQLGDNFNLVWKALEKKAAAGGGDGSLKEFLMSISGTLIVQKDVPPKALSSLVSKELIAEYIGVKTGNAKIELYSCDEQGKCLSPRIRQISLSASDTLFGQIDKLLVSIVEKVKKNNSNFTDEEENLIALSSLPLIKKIQIDLGTHSDSTSATVRVAEFVEALCYDVVTTHLTKSLQQIALAVEELTYLQISEVGVFDKFQDRISETLKFLSDAKSVAFRRYDIIAQTKARMIQEESYFQMKFEDYVQNNNEGSPDPFMPGGE